MSRGYTPEVLGLLRERQAEKRAWIVEAKRHNVKIEGRHCAATVSARAEDTEHPRITVTTIGPRIWSCQ